VQKIRFYVHLSAEKYQAYYQGHANAVVVRAYDGRTLQFPANVLRPFLTHKGIYGEFEVEIDHNNKLQNIQRVG
jgi:hypothetical protein